jgi:DNA-directed RNA polymerase specialized sigma24 family protein
MEKQIKTKPVDQQSEDYELLLMMSWKADDEEEAKKAFKSFYYNHYTYFEAVANKVCSTLQKEYVERSQIKDALLNNLFKRVYEKAGTMTKALDKFSHLDADDMRRKIRAYMGTMAKNIFLELMKSDSDHNEKMVYRSDEAYFKALYRRADVAEEAEDYLPKSREAAAIAEGLKSLTERERDVLLNCMRYEEEGKDLPDEVIQEICAYWGILPGNMRLIKHRAFKKLEKIAKEHINQ